MTAPTSDIAFTPSVKAIQERLGSRRSYESMEQRDGWSARIDEELEAFIAQRDSFYLATASAEGRPYIQHRGGPPGFLKVIDEQTLAFADFSGNKQYISTGNLSENDQAFIFLMDYANQRRIKIWGRAKFVEDDFKLMESLTDPSYRGRPERVMIFQVEAWDVNCPQHIPLKLSENEISARERALHERVIELQTENARLRRS